MKRFFARMCTAVLLSTSLMAFCTAHKDAHEAGLK